MIIKKRTTTLAGGAALALTFAVAPLHADEHDKVSSDPMVNEAAAETALTAEEAEMALDEAEAEVEAATAEAGEELEDAAIAVEETTEAAAAEAGEEIDEAAAVVEAETEAAVATAIDAADDDETAALLQQRIGQTPELAVYGLDVIELDGRYSVNGMIDDSEDYALLQRVIADIDGLDASMVDNNVVTN